MCIDRDYKQNSILQAFNPADAPKGIVTTEKVSLNARWCEPST